MNPPGPAVIRGPVVAGQGLGRGLGFPTANVSVPGSDLPPFGVYRADAIWDGVAHPAVCNVGVRPTLVSAGSPWVEVHVLDFDGDLYGRVLEVRLREKLRDEKRFASRDELVEQIRRDVALVSAACRRSAGAGPESSSARSAIGRRGTRTRRIGRKGAPS
ncbi:MAG: riboflavin kinase [Elusimicrobiota bacterium]